MVGAKTHCRYCFSLSSNLRSRRVMEKLGMTHNVVDDFQSPKLPLDPPLSWHVLYRKEIL